MSRTTSYVRKLKTYGARPAIKSYCAKKSGTMYLKDLQISRLYVLRVSRPLSHETFREFPDRPQRGEFDTRCEGTFRTGHRPCSSHLTMPDSVQQLLPAQLHAPTVCRALGLGQIKCELWGAFRLGYRNEPANG